jgi:pantetheine-phosphate adenylyltransferase
MSGRRPEKPFKVVPAKQRLAVYPGSFDPPHNGHLDIIQRCLPIFDELLVAILRNEEKEPLFSIEQREEMIREAVGPNPRIRVQSFSGLLVDFMDRVNAVTIVRGLRALSDFDYEFQMALMNRHLNPRVETVFMMPKEEYSYLSSRLAKEAFALGGDISGLVPATVLRRMRRKMPRRNGR